MEQVATDARQSLRTIPASKPARASNLPEEAVQMGLTQREWEVLQLLAEGLTNAQITQRLVISVVTVNSYLRSIYGKLGVSTCTAATRFALDHHLPS